MKGLDLIIEFGSVLFDTIRDVSPILLLIGFYQIFVIKKPIPNLKNVFLGFIFVILGLAMFLMGLDKALFPIGRLMAVQLSSPDFVQSDPNVPIHWGSYYWVYIFSAMVGFATTLAEPALKAVALKANSISGGTLNEWTLRLTVAFGAGMALALGTFRIVTGTPLYYYLLVCYLIVIIQTIFAPKSMVALAYDSGGVTTSTVTVPIVAALGLGLSSSVEGSNPALDGFGLIALVCMFPIISVLGYLQLIDIIKKISKTRHTP
jgi:hypothetical protein